MTNNGSCYKSHAFRGACKALGLKHIRTRTYTPKINGKGLPPRKRGPSAFSGEMIHRIVSLSASLKTALNEWAYARAYKTRTSARPICPNGSTAIIGTGPMAE